MEDGEDGGDYFVLLNEPRKGFIYYSPCTCRERYYLPPTSSLYLYLKNECLGWEPSSDHYYNLNYLMIVLITNFKAKNLLKEDIDFDTYYVKCDEKLKSLMDMNYLNLFSFRETICEKFLNVQERHQAFLYRDSPLFKCVDHTWMNLVKDVIGSDPLGYYHSKSKHAS